MRYTPAIFPFLPLTMSKVSSIIGWICVGLVAAFTLFSAVMNMLPIEGNQAAIDIATRLGVLDMLFALGVTKLVLVALYIFPRTSTVGFVLMVGYYGGALATNLTHEIGFDSVMFPLDVYTPFFLVFLFLTIGAYIRNPELLTRIKGKPVVA